MKQHNKLRKKTLNGDEPAYSWGQWNNLKYTYENKEAGEVKTYKLTKEEMEEYCKKFK